MLVAPVRRRTLIAVERKVAMTRGPWPVRTAERSSSKTTSTDPVQAVLDGPVPLDPGGDLLRGCLRGGHRGDDVDDLDALLAREGAGASDLGDLDRTGEVQQCGCGGDLDRAPDPAPVPDVHRRGRADLGPGQCCAPGEQARLVG